MHIQGFPYWGMGRVVPPPVKNLLIPPTKSQSSSYNPIKTAFLAVVNAPAPFLF